MKINRIRPLESDFLEVLNSIALKLEILYYRGKIPDFVEKGAKKVSNGASNRERPKTLAIVGARKHTKYGEKVAYETAFALAKQGVIIVSGLALGIDSIAHRGALDAGGRTIAVLGTQIDRIYPSGHKRLAEEILAKDGLILSEYGVGAQILPKVSFLERNRMIAGLSDAILVIEAADRSGTLNTASHALDQNKDLWVVPGNIDSLYSKGCNKLLKQGAEPFLEVQDLMQYFGLTEQNRRKKTIKGDNALEQRIIEVIRGGIYEGEEIMVEVGIDISGFNIAVTMMEVKGMVRRLGLNRWGLVE